MTRRVAAVVGQPIGHSLSPAIHSAWIEAAGLDARYLALSPNDEAEFLALVNEQKTGSLIGMNVTAPYKEAALAWARAEGAVIGETAQAAGSVNLLLLDGAPRADSTDGEGLIAALDDQAPGWRESQRPVAVLGAGGAARAAVQALIAAGTGDIRVVNRTAERAEALARDLGPAVSGWTLARSGEAMDGARLLVNAATGIEPPDLSSLADGAAVMDMSYRPILTPLLRAAGARGLKPVDGLAMLIGQARPSFEALFGAPVPAIDVRAVALAAMGDAA